LSLQADGGQAITLPGAAKRVRQGRLQVAGCNGWHQVCLAEMLCIPESDRRLQGRSEHVTLHYLQQVLDIHGDIRGDIRGRLFRQRVYRQSND
jgi:hypothetical protein